MQGPPYLTFHMTSYQYRIVLYSTLQCKAFVCIVVIQPNGCKPIKRSFVCSLNTSLRLITIYQPTQPPTLSGTGHE